MDNQCEESDIDVVTCSTSDASMAVLSLDQPLSPRSATLRKRKTATKKSASKIWQHVTEHEMALTSLPATSCRVINSKMKNRTTEDTPVTGPSRNARTPGKSNSKRAVCSHNDGFSVKTGAVSLYSKELTFDNLYKHPTTLCPSPEDHVIRVFEMNQEVPLACPTCWSVQRNG